MVEAGAEALAHEMIIDLENAQKDPVTDVKEDGTARTPEEIFMMSNLPAECSSPHISVKYSLEISTNY